MEIVHQPCPHPDCDSSDAFSFNTQGYGFCHSCGNSYPKKGIKYDPYFVSLYPTGGDSHMGAVKEVAPKREEMYTQVFREDRDISKEVMEFFGVHTLVDSEGTSRKHVYKYPSGSSKVRTLPKSFHTEGGFSSDELFGMDKFNSGTQKFVVLTEGELDAMSAFQMLDRKYPCVSLPSATPSKKLFSKCKDWLDSFERIYLSFDSDGKSEGVAQKLVNLFPNRVYSIPHDKYKDANEFLQRGAKQAYKNAFQNARKYTPENVFNTPEHFLGIYRESNDSIYIPTGISDLDALLLGLMQGHLTVFHAPEGRGKSEFMRYLEYQILSNHRDVPIAICHMEETKRRSVLGLVSYHLRQNLTRKELVTTSQMEPQVEEAIVQLTEHENLYQFALGVDDDPLDILDKIRFFAEACGCKYVFFEPIQDLGYSRSGDQTLESFLSELATKLSRLASELNVGIITIAHENDDGAIRDCRMIGKRASVVVKLERDIMHEDPTVRNTTTLTVVKNRPAGDTGYGGQLKFDPTSFTLSEA